MPGEVPHALGVEEARLQSEKRIKVVSNAGGLDPEACAQAIRDLGTGAKVAAVTGDDVLPRFGEFDWTNLDTGEAFPSHARVCFTSAPEADVLVGIDRLLRAAAGA